MYSPRGFYNQAPALRIRPIPEMGFCLVFTPAKPRLFTLNSSAWLVLALCDGRSGKSIEKAYAATLGVEARSETVRAEIRGILDDLECKAIVQRRRTSAHLSEVT